MKVSQIKRARSLTKTSSGHYKVENKDNLRVEHIGTHTECIRIIQGISIKSLKKESIIIT
jgi:hypothetical protein